MFRIILAYVASLYAPCELTRLIFSAKFESRFLLELGLIWIAELCLGYFIVKKQVADL